MDRKLGKPQGRGSMVQYATGRGDARDEAQEQRSIDDLFGGGQLFAVGGHFAPVAWRPTVRIPRDAISQTELSSHSVTTAKIAPGAVTAGEIAENAITETQISDGSITTPMLAANAVTAAKIAANTITAAEIAANAITASEISSGAVTAAKISGNTITANEIAADAITASELAANAVTATEIAAGAVTATKINVSTLSAIAANMGTVTAGTITGVTITGALIRTSATNPKIEISDSFPDEIRFLNGSGTLRGTIRLLADDSLGIADAGAFKTGPGIPIMIGETAGFSPGASLHNYLEMVNTGGNPPAPPAGRIRFYWHDVSGIRQLRTRDDAGTIHAITRVGV